MKRAPFFAALLPCEAALALGEEVCEFHDLGNVGEFLFEFFHGVLEFHLLAEDDLVGLVHLVFVLKRLTR